MAENKKMTKKEYFGILREIVIDRPELVAFIDNELTLLSKKANSSKMTSTQKENEEIKKVIVKTLEDLSRYATITEIQDSNDMLALLSNQKITLFLHFFGEKFAGGGNFVPLQRVKKYYFICMG